MSRRKNKKLPPLEVRIYNWFCNLMIFIGILFIIDASDVMPALAAEANVIYITTEAANEEEPIEPIDQVKFKAFTNINIRKTPSLDGEVIGNISGGEYIDNVISTSKEWTLVQYNNITGYVNNSYIGTDETYEEYLKKQDDIKTKVLKCSSYLEEKYGFSSDLQMYLFNQTKSVYSNLTDQLDYYYFCLAVIQQESDFKSSAKHKNDNGTTDLGLMQINSSLWKDLKKKGIISSSDDLYNSYTNIIAGLDELNQCVKKYGLTENAYYMYNTGKRNKAGTNKNSKKVWEYFLEWKDRFETN